MIAQKQSTDLADNQGLGVDLRSQDGGLLRRVSLSQADELIAAGLAEPVGKNRMKYVRLLYREPARAQTGEWMGGSHTTRRIRNDAGVMIGAPRTGLEHKSTL